jgi:hypothetical protein
MWLVAAVLSLPVALTSAEAARERGRAPELGGVRAAIPAGYCDRKEQEDRASSDRLARHHPLGGEGTASRVTFA